ncbi:MAG: amidohydrolase [Anaerovoracaceae bacterium]
MKYDILFVNGKIFTADSARSYAASMAVKDGKIAWIGDGVPEGDAVRTVDLCAKRVLPGFVDSHMHAIMLANCCKQISALPPAIYSIQQLTEEIARVRKNQGPEQWIEGWGYDEGKLKEGRTPTCLDLDAGCSDAPVKILRTCGHVCVVNSRVLELAGITAETPDPQGGRIGRFEGGRPNGVLYENARNLVNGLQPEPTVDQLGDNLKDLGEILVSQGVTTCADMGEFIDYDYKEVYANAIEKGFPLRVAGYYMWDSVKDKPGFTITKEDQDPCRQFRAAGIKLIGDGSVSGRTAWCDQPYLPVDGQNEETFGMPVCTEEDMDAAIQFAKEHKCQVSVHCMGAQAIDRAVEHTWRESPWMENPAVPSVRMEHVAMPTAEAIRRTAQSGIAWVTQPVFLYAEIESYLKNLGAWRTAASYPIADFLKEGVRLAFSTDAPATAWATPSDPFTNLKGAVTRKAWDGTDCGQAHRVDIETAIRLYTAESAPMLGFTDTGMLKEGYAADFIVLDRDILEIPAEEIDQVKVEETWIGGKKVYRKK